MQVPAPSTQVQSAQLPDEDGLRPQDDQAVTPQVIAPDIKERIKQAALADQESKVQHVSEDSFKRFKAQLDRSQEDKGGVEETNPLTANVVSEVPAHNTDERLVNMLIHDKPSDDAAKLYSEGLAQAQLEAALENPEFLAKMRAKLGL